MARSRPILIPDVWTTRAACAGRGDTTGTRGEDGRFRILRGECRGFAGRIYRLHLSAFCPVFLLLLRIPVLVKVRA